MTTQSDALRENYKGVMTGGLEGCSQRFYSVPKARRVSNHSPELIIHYFARAVMTGGLGGNYQGPISKTSKPEKTLLCRVKKIFHLPKPEDMI